MRGGNVVVLGVEKKAVAKLQDERTVQKICVLDNHVMMAFAGKDDEKVATELTEIYVKLHQKQIYFMIY